MRELKKLYKGSFFSVRYKFSWRAPFVCSAVLAAFGSNIHSVIDVGCGIGDLVAEFKDRGLISEGIEGTDNCIDYLECPSSLVKIHDLRDPLSVDLKFDLVTCFEVAEHIEPERAEQFIDNITGLSKRLVMSIAGPGQGGHGHFNCQPMEYWEDKMKGRSFYRNKQVENKVKEGLFEQRHKPGIKAIYNNMIYFEEGLL